MTFSDMVAVTPILGLVYLVLVAASLPIAILLCRHMARRNRGAGENHDRTRGEAPTGHGTCTPVLTEAMRLAIQRRRNQEAAARRSPPFGDVWDAESWR